MGDEFYTYLVETLKCKMDNKWNDKILGFYNLIMNKGGSCLAGNIAKILGGPCITQIKKYRREHRQNFAIGISFNSIDEQV